MQHHQHKLSWLHTCSNNHAPTHRYFWEACQTRPLLPPTKVSLGRSESKQNLERHVARSNSQVGLPAVGGRDPCLLFQD